MNSTTRLFTFIFLFLLKQSSSLGAEISVTISRINDSDTSISLEYFNAVPDTILLWGCRGEFSYNLANSKKDKYILFISSEGFAIISINNKLIYLDKISETNHSNKKLKQKYKGQNFELTLNLKRKREEYLVTHYNGTLILTYNNKSYFFQIIGQFAC